MFKRVLKFQFRLKSLNLKKYVVICTKSQELIIDKETCYFAASSVDDHVKVYSVYNDCLF